jgi:tRNA nucleotidyltransferase (CCA-adding enzyme)
LPTSSKELIDFVDSLGLDAYLVGGAVRDELLGVPHKDQDFVVPGVGYDELRSALARHGKVEDLEVAGQRVGLRLYPRDTGLRAVAPAGIEFAPPRTERSTGPGRHDFEIVASPEVTLEQDMARRDFTINAIAKRLATGELLDPFRGREDLEQRVLRTVSPQSFREDPLRLVRGLRFVSQLDVVPDEATLQQMREEASAIGLVSGERIGGGLAADGMGELSKLLLGSHPAKALGLMRETSVLGHVLPEVQGDGFGAVQAAADLGAPLHVRLAALLNGISPEAAAGALARLRYPNRLRRRVLQLVRGHTLELPGSDPIEVRRFLARHGDELAFDLVELREAQGGDVAEARSSLVAERDQPHRVADLAVDGGDLLELGIPQGPVIGQTLDQLLAQVVDDPELNTRERLLELAEELR